MNEEAIEFGWWIRIVTAKPICTYYFGPFESRWLAEYHKNGYVQDLKEEGAKLIDIDIEQCQPKELTILESELKAS